MADMIERTLPSGATLRFNVAPFADARELYQVILSEIKDVPFNSKRELGEVIKELVCIVASSKPVEAAIWQCFKKALYNNVKITEQTFEPVEARDDYLTACLEVTKENIMPFTKSLYAEYGHLLTAATSGQT